MSHQASHTDRDAERPNGRPATAASRPTARRRGSAGCDAPADRRLVCGPPRRPACKGEVLRSRSDSALIGSHDDPQPTGGLRREQDCFPSPQHLAFARWFADWWLRRGQHLTDPDGIVDNPQRAVAYIRESTEEQGQGFSPDAQRESIRRFASENNLELTGEYCDFHSGWRKSEARPEFQRLMADAAEAKFDVVLVFHTSRFARNQIEARRYKQLLRERLGIRVVSVTQPMGEDPSDPSAFLAESIHEMFDEYYSVSLSFWTRSGLREKARQGYLVGSLPWGYLRDLDTKIAVPDPDRAPLVLQLFERYATGQESDRTLAAWLNATGERTARGRQFGKDTVREMLCNAAYAGYVSGLRDKSRAIKGLHEPILTDELFDRVQEVRGWRTRVVKPGPPSDEYLLRKLLRCERCGARMHGTRGSKTAVRRYMCSTRRYGHSCGERIVQAETLEAQLIDWLRAFQPKGQLHDLLLQTLNAQTAEHTAQPTERRNELLDQLQRLQDLYVLGDLTKAQYIMRRQALEEELQRQSPPTKPAIDRAEALLNEFPRFWDLETEPPSAASSCSRYSSKSGLRTGRSSPCNHTTTSSPTSKPSNTGRHQVVPKAGATGLEPATSAVTGRASLS
jgi:site-specific DNA recombinase